MDPIELASENGIRKVFKNIGLEQYDAYSGMKGILTKSSRMQRQTNVFNGPTQKSGNSSFVGGSWLSFAVASGDSILKSLMINVIHINYQSKKLNEVAFR